MNFTNSTRPRCFPCLLALVSAMTAGLQAQTETATNLPAPELCVMTYNLRYASTNPPNAWPERRPLVREVIRTVAPDVIGTQEGVYSQLQDLAADLPEFDWIGTGRDGGNQGEFMAVFYRTSRLERVATGYFWLSDTPEVIGSTSWGNSFRRMVTWVKFRDRKTTNEFFLFNTHFDHQVQLAREKSAELVRQRVAALETTLPVLLIGDFNAAAGLNKAYEILTREDFFRDTWKLAHERHGEGINTFNDFKTVQTNGTRIDWILARGVVNVRRSEIVTFARDDQFPSDHFPVVAWLQFQSTK